MANPLQIRTGTEATIPILNARQLGFTNDTDQLFIGNGTINLRIPIYNSNGAIPIRVYSTTSLATLTPEKDTFDSFTLTAQAAALTIANPVTTVANDFDQIQIRIFDNGTAQTITFGTDYVVGNNNSLPTTTTIGVTMNLGFEWNGSSYVLLAMD